MNDPRSNPPLQSPQKSLAFFMAVLFLATLILTPSDDALLSQAIAEEAMALSSVPSTIIDSPKHMKLGESTSDLNLVAGKSVQLKFDQNIFRVSVANPEIADVVVLGPNLILLVSKNVGSTNIIVWNESGISTVYNVTVTNDAESVKTALKAIAPEAEEEIEVYPSGDSYVIKGKVSTLSLKKRLIQAAKRYSKDVVNMLEIKEPKQILLEVRFAEVDLTATKDMGLDLQFLTRRTNTAVVIGRNNASLEGEKTLQPSGATTSSGGFTPRNSFAPYTLLSEGSGRYTYAQGYTAGPFNMQSFLELMQVRNLAKIIARPNLLTNDGEEASFLSGGEFPIPVSTSNFVNVQFKEFGTRLKFKPEITARNTIRLTVEPEVSELDTSTVVSVGGFNLPAITTRKSKVVVELAENETLVISGIVQQRQTRGKSSVPYFGSIPFLGKIFHSMTKTYTEVELIVTVTPHIVKPMNLKEKKKFFDERLLKKAIRAELPPFPSGPGTDIERLIIQNEPRRTPEDLEWKQKGVFDSKKPWDRARPLLGEDMIMKDESVVDMKKLMKKLNIKKKKLEEPKPVSPSVTPPSFPSQGLVSPIQQTASSFMKMGAFGLDPKSIFAKARIVQTVPVSDETNAR